MIYTVKGPIEKNELGITLGHEHFKWEGDEEYANQMYFDGIYDDEDIEKSYDLILPVLKELHKLSCRAVVETSPPIGGQNIKLLNKLSTASDVHIIPCTGYNLPKHLHELFKENYVSVVSKRWIRDFEEGLETIDGTVIRPGYIKLLLERGKLSDHDSDLLRAAVITSKHTGIPIHCHIMEHEMVYDVIELLEEEEADFSKFLWAHADKEGHEKTIQYAYEKGIWIGFDMIQVGTYEKKYEYLKFVLERGYSDKVLLSQDYDFYEEAVKENENNECTSLFQSFIPYCEKRGIERQVIESMMSVNSAEFYDV